MAVDYDDGWRDGREQRQELVARPAYRPPVGLPSRGEEPKRWSIALSVAVHALIALLLLLPVFRPEVMDVIMGGAGGPGPAGGGGGGRGSWREEFVRERLHYLQLAPTQSAAQPTVPPTVPPPEETPQPEPRPEPVPEAKPDVPPAATPPPVGPEGRGGGTGTDGSNGKGPGSGGGVGSGIGTGQGSSVGPGTGGGEGTIYPPVARTLVINALLTAPKSIRPYRMTAVFEVDERGNVLSFRFNKTRDASFNRRLEAELAEIRFRPATRMDGTPVAARAVLEGDAY